MAMLHTARIVPVQGMGAILVDGQFFVKKEVKNTGGFTLVKQTNDYVWFKFSKNKFSLLQDLYLCLLYIPPPNSSYILSNNSDILADIHQDISVYAKVGHIMLTGDFNARTGTDPDFISNDSDLPLSLDFEYITDKQIMKRHSFDNVTNNRGKEFLDLCVSAKLRIVNGRKIGDTLGYFTCHKWNGSSVVDYAIVSEELFDSIPNMRVSKYLSDLSDHCCLSLNIKASYQSYNAPQRTVLPLPKAFK